MDNVIEQMEMTTESSIQADVDLTGIQSSLESIEISLNIIIFIVLLLVVFKLPSIMDKHFRK